MTVGRIVHYKLGASDAAEINRRRDDAQAFRSRVFSAAAGIEVAAGHEGRTGHVEHAGNRAREGDAYPAIVVRVFDPSVSTANLQVLLDGNDHFWATSRQEGDGPGQWSWPPRA